MEEYIISFITYCRENQLYEKNLKECRLDLYEFAEFTGAVTFQADSKIKPRAVKNAFPGKYLVLRAAGGVKGVDPVDPNNILDVLPSDSGCYRITVENDTDLYLKYSKSATVIILR